MKKLNWLIGFVFALTVITSCKKNDQFTKTGFITRFFIIKNVNGVDLLDPSLTNGIKAGDIDIFVLENGIKKQVFYGMMDMPERFTIYRSQPYGYILRLDYDFRKETFVDNKVTQFIRYKDGSEDKITGEFSVNAEAYNVTKTWVNDVLKWSLENDPDYIDGPILIVK